MKFDAGGMFPYLMLWYLFVVLVLSVIVVVIVVKKGSRKRKSNLTGAKPKERKKIKYEKRKQMEGFISKNRSNARVYYIRQCNRVKSKARIAYKISKKYKLGYSHKFHALNPGYILCKNWYHKNKDSKILKSTCYSKTNYRINPDHKKEASRKHYQNPQPKKEASRDHYQNNPQPKKEASRNHYQKNPNPQKRKSKERYQQNPAPQKQKSLNRYYENRDAINF